MNKSIYTLILLCFTIGCTNGNNKGKTFFSHFQEGPALDSKNWNCLDIDNEKICTPSQWKILPQSKYLYYSSLDSLDKNKYFVILKYNETVSSLNIHKYLAMTYTALIKDTVEKSTSYTSKKLVFNNKTAYYSEYYTRLDNKPYLTYSMVFEN